MELRTLKYFLAVAQEGNISRAAKTLCITQPTLSRQLMDLEEELHTTLFLRGKREITLTMEGLRFQHRAKEIVAMSEKTIDEFTNAKEYVSGVLTLGCVESASASRLYDYVRRFAVKYPNVRYDFYNAYSDDIKDKIDSGRVDIGLVAEPVEISRYHFIRLQALDEWGIVMPKGDPLCRFDSFSPPDLISYPLIIPHRTIANAEIQSWFGHSSQELKIIATYYTFSNVIYLVEQGFAYAIALRNAPSVRENPNVCFRPFRPIRHMTSALIWRKTISPNLLTSLFLQEMEQYVEEDTIN